MIKKKILNEEIMDQIKNGIISTVKKAKPETAKQLVTLLQKRQDITEDQTIKLLIELENESKLNFAERILTRPICAKNYIFSRRATWFWITVVLALTTVAISLTPVTLILLALTVTFATVAALNEYDTISNNSLQPNKKKVLLKKKKMPRFF